LFRLKEICDAKGILLNVVILPELHVLTLNPFQAQHELIGDFLARNNIAHKDFFELFSGEADARRFWVADDDAHPNAVAHHRIAEGLSSIVEEMYAKAESNGAVAGPPPPREQTDNAPVGGRQ
jgi:hypothetical protein